MEVTKLRVRTRDRAMALQVEETVDDSGAIKRRKLCNQRFKSHSSTFGEAKTVDCEMKEKRYERCEVAGNGRSSSAPASYCCSTSSRTIEHMKVSDLEEIVKPETTTARCNSDGIESKTTAMKQSTTMSSTSGRKVSPAGKMPPEDELEEFFAAAQEDLNERFKNKYNYDIVNNIPLKGRYEWIKVTQDK
ncbi:hypothetical protein QVD17_36798 [Tagetes erecta]|uniref:Cyclin-dependent kinase inhibitor n=1 Tax=Tagetes erecta TaxID=13708 RepID=A0AAD8JUW5_TARER|nr:hypothetical protein QVD17_36798 [Tagetes erecta]